MGTAEQPTYVPADPDHGVDEYRDEEKVNLADNRYYPPTKGSSGLTRKVQLARSNSVGAPVLFRAIHDPPLHSDD